MQEHLTWAPGCLPSSPEPSSTRYTIVGDVQGCWERHVYGPMREAQNLQVDF